MKKLLLTTLTVFAFSSQANALPSCHDWNNGSSDTVQAAIDAATTENANAKKVGFEWRDTGKMIQKAIKLSATPCSAAAIALADTAKAQALDAQQQAKDQANAGPRLINQ